MYSREPSATKFEFDQHGCRRRSCAFRCRDVDRRCGLFRRRGAHCLLSYETFRVFRSCLARPSLFVIRSKSKERERDVGGERKKTQGKLVVSCRRTRPSAIRMWVAFDVRVTSSSARSPHDHERNTFCLSRFSGTYSVDNFTPLKIQRTSASHRHVRACMKFTLHYAESFQ